MRCGTSRWLARLKPRATFRRCATIRLGSARLQPSVLAIVAFTAVVACGTRRADETSGSATAAAATNSATGTIPHGDHNSHHGGIVMMKGDLHYEVVLDPTGRSHQIYFTDAVREDLPASIASSARLTIKRPNESAETIPLQIDDAGESWVGHGRDVRDPGRTSAEVSFTIAGEPYSIDVPFVVPLPPAATIR